MHLVHAAAVFPAKVDAAHHPAGQQGNRNKKKHLRQQLQHLPQNSAVLYKDLDVRSAALTILSPAVHHLRDYILLHTSVRGHSAP